ncbi:hypothetical protein IAT38_002956 [Cryptococcus sp. DSM 104549]
MSRPTSSASRAQSSGSSHGTIHSSEVMSDAFTTTPTSATYPPQIVYHDPYGQHASFPHYDIRGQPAYQGDMQGQMITPYADHQVAHGRIVMPMRGPPRIPSPGSAYEEYEFTPYVPENEMTPYHPGIVDRYSHMSHSPSLTHQPLSTTQPLSPPGQSLGAMDHALQRSHSMPSMPHTVPHPHDKVYFPPAPRHQRPPLLTSQSAILQRPTIQTSLPRPGMTRHASLLRGPRSGSPFVAGDVFDHIPEEMVDSPVMHEEMHHPLPPPDMSWELSSFEPNYSVDGQGISPARALGPAPPQAQRFSPHRHDLMITPQGTKIAYSDHIPSSATSTVASTSSNFSSLPLRRGPRGDFDSSDDEHDGPSRAPPARTMRLRDDKKAPPPLMSLPARPQVQAKITAGGRTSAKFAKVAEDPGVEGIPPGPRSHERPAPSFACIIGEAILACKAGGLSLEHIYRYVETGYPYFKSGDNAWRNSVRHNLSIHKMFETISRTEKFPPGKGGIWIIHDDEKVHWPSPGKFIKNFPPTHPHHEHCRQTLHERQKEREAMEKAAREGREYVPKKGKKKRKQLLPLEELGLDASSSMPPMPSSEAASRVKAEDAEGAEEVEEEEAEVAQVAVKEVEPPKPVAKLQLAAVDPVPVYHEDRASWSALGPPPLRFDVKGKRKQSEGGEDDSLFSSAKRVRLAEPLAPIHPFPQETTQGRIERLDASFITPERERPVPNGGTSKLMSSDFKTPALVQSSSSPGSPPMPQTITRSTHHPSALQQAWTHDDMSRTPPRDSSPARPMLDAAFDLKPKPLRSRPASQEDEFPAPPPLASPPHQRAPPKTPVTRSSAATDKTPRLHHRRTPSMAHVTPVVFRGSPGLPPPTSSALMSTPMWEIGGCLDRLKDHFSGSPTGTPHPLRSPAPPTSPTRYAMALLDNNGSPRRGRNVS